MCIRDSYTVVDKGGAVDATANKLEAETIAAKIKAGADVYKRQA